MTESQNQPQGVSRRTIMKGAAWAVPVIAVASATPAFATSHEPPEPEFDFANAYKNPGNSCTTDCVPKQSYGVPVIVKNPTEEDYQIQFTSYVIGTKEVSVHSLTSDVRNCTPLNTTCSPGCATEQYNVNAVCIPAGTTSLTIYVTSGEYGSSPNEGQSISWRWIKKSTCEIIDEGEAVSLDSPPSELC